MKPPSLILYPSSFILIYIGITSALVLDLPVAAAAGTNDRVRLARGAETGEVSDMSPMEVSLNKGLPGSRAIAVNQIKSIVFDSEPPELTQARTSAGNGAFSKALQLLGKIDMNQTRRDFIKQDIEFLKAYCASQLALGGEGQIADAGRQLNSFVRSYPNNFHFLEATELMGDLLMASGRFENAEKQYVELAKAPWPDYKMRAAVNVGRTLQAQNKHAEAIKQFDAALAMSDEGADAQSQKAIATVARAVSVAETGKVDQAAGTIEKIIRDTDPQQKELQARAHIALGKCYEKAGKKREALYAYLYVDVIFNTVPEAHAEALAHLVPLYKAIGQDERAREARETLLQRYANSRWAKAVQ
jgi:tetratricopeptide (TPR) repeat protein